MKCVCGHGEAAHFEVLGGCEICECCHFASRPTRPVVPEPSDKQGEQWPEVEVGVCPNCGEQEPSDPDASSITDVDHPRDDDGNLVCEECMVELEKAVRYEPVKFALASKLSEVEARVEQLEADAVAEQAYFEEEKGRIRDEREEARKALSESLSLAEDLLGTLGLSLDRRRTFTLRGALRWLADCARDERNRADRLQAIIDSLTQQEAVEAAGDWIERQREASWSHCEGEPTNPQWFGLGCDDDRAGADGYCRGCWDCWSNGELAYEVIQAALQTAKKQVEATAPNHTEEAASVAPEGVDR